MKKLFVLFFCLFSFEVEAPSIATMALVMSALTSGKELIKDKNSFPGNLFSGEKKFTAKKMIIVVKKNMNNNAAVTVALVICYDQILAKEVKKMSARQVIKSMEQFKKDYPKDIKILKWQVAAKEKISKPFPLEYPDKPPPKSATIFVDYNGNEPYRGEAPPGVSTVVVTLMKDDFSVKGEE
ncbi:MAG: hypothetical protein LBG20_03775 [Holosporaceae bacterium]|jgi:hypothetical protein|nr:hypothetical protein [Holosporaceae bacterium]